MRTRKSAPTLTERQRRRQIIDLLASHVARMPEAVAISAPRNRETDERDSNHQSLMHRQLLNEVFPLKFDAQ